MNSHEYYNLSCYDHFSCLKSGQLDINEYQAPFIAHSLLYFEKKSLFNF